ncbi:hypothetical protein [Campylobacter upsaliensis]|uniref:hypothetical protein n=1 Tax=Campylobacter upsaliensis TaxID=28080 RepID=UPI001288B153|nr:hypothetical protein [Campylobacter upsaliensis]EAH5848494.1 hypothetical protein [Campylobacter upsaliensis]EAH5879571.1 hypothetical protein [Campylobacter upsaliensis]EAJ3733056.1 hypothetical protein [Campylobacter upsaliensis]EAJ7571481.1 hypothetical protein [Campylobacter upsaliensis]EAL7774142.1 hypothetical protein [Campylobacter upsaliensis]
MTLILENVDTNTLRVIESLQGLNKNLHIKISKETPTIEKTESDSIIEESIADFLKPENYAVFERLKDK